MRKAISVIILAVAFLSTGHAQPSTFFGLKLGQCYSGDQIASILKQNGIKEGPAEVAQEPENNPMGLISYYVDDVSFGGRQYPIMAVQVLPNDHKLVCVSFAIFKDDESAIKPQLEGTYYSMRDSLKRIYPLESVDTGSPDIKRLYYSSTLGTAVRLDRYLDGGYTSVIDLSYLSALDIAMALLNATPTLPDIQDTFFGLKMGKAYTHSQIKSAFISKGTFLNESSSAGQNSVTFTDVYFAGSTWNYCDVMLSSKNELYVVDFYNSYSEFDYNEETGTKKSYKTLKERLDSKYGEAETKEEDSDLSTIYIGGNNILIILSKEKSKSKGGSYRQYFHLSYYQRDVMSAESKASDDEL